MSQITLANFVETTSRKFKIPGVAVGVWADGKASYACHGVTSVENSLPIDPDTLFALGSITKTFTATMLMRLVAEGKVELNAPVRRYVPELQLKDQQTTDQVTVLHVLNHTAGFDWRVNADTGEGDDALEHLVEKMAEMDLIAPLGSRVSYSQVGYSLLGRIIEKVTDQTFEQAVSSLVCEPLGLSHSFFARDEIMTRRFTVGHDALARTEPCLLRDRGVIRAVITQAGALPLLWQTCSASPDSILETVAQKVVPGCFPHTCYSR